MKDSCQASKMKRVLNSAWISGLIVVRFDDLDQVGSMGNWGQTLNSLSESSRMVLHESSKIKPRTGPFCGAAEKPRS